MQICNTSAYGLLTIGSYQSVTFDYSWNQVIKVKLALIVTAVWKKSMIVCTHDKSDTRQSTCSLYNHITIRPEGIMLQIFITILFRISSKIVSLLCSKSTDYSQLYWRIFTTFLTFAIKKTATIAILQLMRIWVKL